MKLDAVVVAALVGLVSSTSGRADDDNLVSEVRPCDECEDLCELVDTYMEREVLVEMYRKYAASTVSSPGHINLPPNANVVAIVYAEFQEWALTRQFPCQAGSFAPTSRPPPPPQLSSGGTPPRFDFEVTPTNCDIRFNGQPLKEVQKVMEQAVNCKAISDSVIEHEKVHQRHCVEAHMKNPATALETLTDNANMAQSELEAHIKHRDLLADQIRKIVNEKNCGWNPTAGQQYSGAMPTAAQVKKMQERGWQAVQSLGGK